MCLKRSLFIPILFVLINGLQLTNNVRQATGKEVEMAQFRVGDKIIYHKPKSSFCPGPRAKQVYPLEHGEAYHYVVDKFWKVEKVNDDGTLDLVTRTGKKNKLQANDPNISKAHLFQHLLYRKRFLELNEVL
jgi:hypothetical protein